MPTPTDVETMLSQDFEDLESLARLPAAFDVAIFCIKPDLPVLWIVSDPLPLRDKTVPSAASFQQLNLEEGFSLSETFSIFPDADFYQSELWERSSDDNRLRARMLEFTGAKRPQKRATAEQQSGDFLKTKLNRAMYSQLEEQFPPLNECKDRVEEEFDILKEHLHFRKSVHLA